MRLRETNKYGAENIKRQNERNRKKQPKTQRSTWRKKTNPSNKKGHQGFLFCQKKPLRVRECSVRPSCKALFSLEERVGFKKCCLIEVIYFIHFFLFFPLIILECLRSTKDSSQVFIYIPQTSSISGFSLTEEKQFPYKNEAA